MRYTKNNAIYDEYELRDAIPNVSLPETLLPEHVAEFGFLPYVEPEPPAPTPQQLVDQLQGDVVARTQQRLDDFARTRNYDGILSLCTYATSPTAKFAAEGQYGVTARDATWAKLYDILAQVQAGTRPMPAGYTAIEPELPALVWPA